MNAWVSCSQLYAMHFTASSQWFPAIQHQQFCAAAAAAAVAAMPFAGLFLPVAAPAATRSLLAQQNFMVNIQAPPGVKFTPLTPQTSQAGTSISSAHHVVSPIAAAAAASPMQQGLTGRQPQQQLQQQQQQQQQVLSAVVTAWQELVVMLHSMRLKGLYCLLPALVEAVKAGDADAAYVFKNVSTLQLAPPTLQIVWARASRLSWYYRSRPVAYNQQHKTCALLERVRNNKQKDK
jgi:hypothetical protein